MFPHRGHISSIRRTGMSIYWWLPQSGRETAEAPGLKRYGDEFDGRTGSGGLEIWIPIQG